MNLTVFNTKSQKKEVVTPIVDGHIGMYNCGPTVYKNAHIGNLRAYVLADLLRRAFEINGLKVKQIINITDVGHLTHDSDDGEDRMTLSAKEQKKSAQDIADFYTKAFFDDLRLLNIKTLGTLFPKASEHIKEQIDIIEKLEKNGFAYKTSDGIYFDSSKFKSYGHFAKLNLKGIEPGKRIVINSEKRNPTDFALWKLSRGSDKRQQQWPSPWGDGFPGWHIECSAMSMKYLGETFDVHTGGIDHVFPHHTNEIAQSEAATGKPFANYWLHGEFVNIAGEKMAKSGGNFITLEGLIKKDTNPLSYRYYLLGAHYRTVMNFSFEALQNADISYKKLLNHVGELPHDGGKIIEKYSSKFLSYMNDDLDSPRALSLIWDILKDKKSKKADLFETIKFIDGFLGLGLCERNTDEIPQEVVNIAEKRLEARNKKDWKTSDKLRNEIESQGYEIKDTEKGFKITKR